MTFAVRDLFWLVALAALVCAWWVDRGHRFYELERSQIRLESAQRAEEWMKSDGWKFDWSVDDGTDRLHLSRISSDPPADLPDETGKSGRDR